MADVVILAVGLLFLIDDHVVCHHKWLQELGSKQFLAHKTVDLSFFLAVSEDCVDLAFDIY